MRKILTILTTIVSIIIIAFLLWYLLLRNPSMPVGEVVRNVLPFGSGNDATAPIADSSPPIGADGQLIIDKFSAPTTTTGLFRISEEPVAGMVVLNNGTSTIVRYVDRATGHIYDADLATLKKVKVTNQTLPMETFIVSNKKYSSSMENQ